MVYLEVFSKLEENELELLNKTMKDFDGNFTTPGRRVVFKLNRIHSILNDNPQYKNLWPQFRAIHDSVLLGSKELAVTDFAERFMKGLDAVIDAIRAKDEKALGDKLKLISDKHKQCKIMRVHIAQMSECFVSMLHTELAGEFTPEMKMAWQKMFKAIGDALEM